MNAAALTADTIQTTAPTALWRVAAAFMHILHALFGAPEDVAARHTITLKAHKLMASWLRAGEAMMRRLLLIEAAAYAKPNTRPLMRPSRKRARKLMSFTADAPEKWRVSFRCFSDRRLPAGQDRNRQRANTLKTVQLRSAWPLAERYEALLRVFNNPLRHARRLSRQLHATPHRAYELLRADLDAEHRVDRFEDMTVSATTCAVVLNTS